MRLRLKYGDHNERFAPLLSRDGKVERVVSSADGNSWALFHLDAPIDFEGRVYNHLLLRSRWVGKEIGDPPPVPVFILLVNELWTAVDGFGEKDFEHVAWGEAEPL